MKPDPTAQAGVKSREVRRNARANRHVGKKLPTCKLSLAFFYLYARLESWFVIQHVDCLQKSQVHLGSLISTRKFFPDIPSQREGTDAYYLVHERKCRNRKHEMMASHIKLFVSIFFARVGSALADLPLTEIVKEIEWFVERRCWSSESVQGGPSLSNQQIR